MQVEQLTDTLNINFDNQESEQFLIYMKTIITSKGFPIESINDVINFQNKFHFNWQEMFNKFQIDRKWE